METLMPHLQQLADAICDRLQLPQRHGPPERHFESLRYGWLMATRQHAPSEQSNERRERVRR